MADRWNNKYWSFLKDQKFLKEFKQILPQTADLRNHTAEIKIDALAPGRYVLLASGDQSFSINKNPLSAQYFYVSQIAYINKGNDYFVLNRESGKPLQQADVAVWTQTYDYTLRKYQVIKRANLKADLDGYFKLPVIDKNNEPVRLEINIKGDRLFLDDTEYRTYSENKTETTDREEYEKDQRKLFLFTDRSIYRPGQTVYFKGIIITRDFTTKKFKVVPGFTSKIELFNANSETIDSLDVKAGEFGTFSGSFKLPENGLTGEFSIEDFETKCSSSFNVEEYKRPTFYIDYKNTEREYRLNDTVTTAGVALGYAGNSMDGASVKYRVTRNSRFPFPWLYRGYGFPRSEPVEITQGKIKTKPDGTFQIRFKAIPDNSIDKNILPVFEYEVSVDITDISGETRSASTFVSIGYHALVLGMRLPADKILQNDKTQSIGISASNLSGVPQTTQVQMAVYPLTGPQRLIRQRYWNKPDTFVMTEKEYLQYFPFDEYADESKKENWQKGKAVFEKTDSIKGNQYMLDLPTTTLSPGWYLLEAKAKDSYGQQVNAIEYFQVMDSKSGVVDRYGYFSSRITKPVLQPGDTTKLQINTQADGLWIIQLTDGYKNPADKKTPTGKISRPMDAIAYEDPGHPYRFYNLNKETKEFSYIIKEEDRGGFGVSHAFVKHNRFFYTDDIISVPWKNKELDISFTTYRDKTLPGSSEEWTVNIKGNKGDKVAAEILASMYDASLDQFRYHQWQKPSIYENYPSRDGVYLLVPWTAPNSFKSVVSQNWRYAEPDVKMYVKNYDALIWESGSRYDIMPMQRRNRVDMVAAAPMADSAAVMLEGKAAGVQLELNEEVTTKKELSYSVSSITQTNSPDPSTVQIRKNFNETAFFFPQLKTDSAGNVKFTFTMPEAMTQWKWQVLAHTKDLSFGLASKSIITQKELMVQPNAPRFLREGDQLVFPARISNLTDKELSGQAQLQVIDAESGQVVDGLFSNIFPTQYFTVAANQGTLVNFNLTIPGNYSKPVIYRIIAKAGDHSDGEEKAIPILSNRILLTESMPMQLRGTGSKIFSFDKLLQSASSQSLTHHKLTIEYSSNPAWYAVQSLPYLTTYPHDCAEQVFNRFYANAMAAKIVASTPKIKAYYQQWLKDSANGKSGALISNLSKNPELKSILLEETPWVLEAKNETEQKRNIAVLFDLTRLSREMDAALAKLQQAQSPNGGFVWFSGGPDYRYITQYIITGLGKLKKAGAIPEAYKKTTDRITQSGLVYLHKRIKEDYENLVKIKANLNDQQISSLQIQYLYALSFHLDQPMEGVYLKAMTYYHNQAQQFWQKQNAQLQAMTALVLFRSKDGGTSKAIINSLRERAIKNETLGMYWKNAQPAYFWQDAPIETQALLIEAFSEVSQDEASVSSMKQWLLTQKQTNSWSSTKATADACYALLMKGSNWLDADRITTIKVGTNKPLIFTSEKESEAGSGYFKSVIDGTQLQPDMGKIEVTVKGPATKENESISWGAAYWQYFENLDQVKPSTSPLNLVKKIYVEKNTDKGPLLVPMAEGESYKVGDKLKVRIELRSDRDMEYVHLSDMRASGSEPVNVLSGYKWQGALGYYESTKDAATHFFFNRIPKGTYVFEYPLFVSHEGKFSVCVATVECMYAPEFRAHSEGITVKFQR